MRYIRSKLCFYNKKISSIIYIKYFTIYFINKQFIKYNNYENQEKKFLKNFNFIKYFFY